MININLILIYIIPKLCFQRRKMCILWFILTQKWILFIKLLFLIHLLVHLRYHMSKIFIIILKMCVSFQMWERFSISSNFFLKKNWFWSVIDLVCEEIWIFFNIHRIFLHFYHLILIYFLNCLYLFEIFNLRIFYASWII